MEHAAAAAGFATVKAGPEAIKTHLIELSKRSDGSADPVKQAHGRFFFALDSHLRDDASYDVFRDILRSAVLEIWPVGAGEALFGEALGQRRLHSVATASKELGIDADRLRPLLIEAGAISPEDYRPDARATFEAATHAELLDSIARLVTSKEMCRALNSTAVELKNLEEAGILSPKSALSGARRRWHEADAKALLQELASYAEQNRSAQDRGWLSIQSAQARTGVNVGDIFAGTRKGDIKLRQVDPGAGYRGFEVAVEDVTAYGRRETVDGIFSDRQSLAEFGRMVGIREPERLESLINAGELSARRVIHPATRRAQWRVTDSQIKAFRERFLTLSMMQSEFGLQRMTARAILQKAGVGRYAPGGQDLGAIYLRSEVEAVLRAAII